MNQITEDFVSFEIAKLLKEKGFDNEEVSENGGFYCDYECDGTDIGIVYESEMLNKDLARNEYLRPTHQMTIKWLREVHRIETHIVLSELNADNSRKYMFDIYSSDINRDFDSVQKEGFNSYEQAVEAACLYVLKNLI